MAKEPAKAQERAKKAEPRPVCVDASFSLKLVLPEPDSPKVRRLWERWVEEDRPIVAPWLWIYEVTSVLRNRVHRGLLTPSEGDAALQALQAQGVRLLHPTTLQTTAWRLAERFHRPTAYDSFYLALAQELGCDLWTADKRLYHAVAGTLPYVRWIGEAAES